MTDAELFFYEERHRRYRYPDSHPEVLLLAEVRRLRDELTMRKINADLDEQLAAAPHSWDPYSPTAKPVPDLHDEGCR